VNRENGPFLAAETKSARQVLAVEVAALEVAQENLRKRRISWVLPLIPVPMAIGAVVHSANSGTIFPWAMVAFSAVIVLLVIAYKEFYETRYHRALRDGMARMLERAKAAAFDGTPQAIAEEYARFVTGTAFLAMNGMLWKRFRFDLAPKDVPANA
jgi:hypothetical protein